MSASILGGIAQDSNLTGLRGQLPAALNADGGVNVHVTNPSSGGGGSSAPSVLYANVYGYGGLANAPIALPAGTKYVVVQQSAYSTDNGYWKIQGSLDGGTTWADLLLLNLDGTTLATQVAVGAANTYVYDANLNSAYANAQLRITGQVYNTPARTVLAITAYNAPPAPAAAVFPLAVKLTGALAGGTNAIGRALAQSDFYGVPKLLTTTPLAAAGVYAGNFAMAPSQSALYPGDSGRFPVPKRARVTVNTDAPGTLKISSDFTKDASNNTVTMQLATLSVDPVSTPNGQYHFDIPLHIGYLDNTITPGTHYLTINYTNGATPQTTLAIFASVLF